jgi:hypothetical protein
MTSNSIKERQQKTTTTIQKKIDLKSLPRETRIGSIKTVGKRNQRQRREEKGRVGPVSITDADKSTTRPERS